LSKLVIRNSDVKRVIIGIPHGHKHVRTILFLKNGTLVEFQEATIANILRAFITIKTHPSISAIELKGCYIKERKSGFAEYQLLETEKTACEVQNELSRLINQKE